jgi:hypothetical protein
MEANHPGSIPVEGCSVINDKLIPVVTVIPPGKAVARPIMNAMQKDPKILIVLTRV